MSIGKILGSSFVKSTVGFVKKNPLLVAGGAGLVGLIGYSAATSTRNQQIDKQNARMILMNPFLNPIGWWEYLPTQEKVQESYKNGGRGVIFDAAA